MAPRKIIIDTDPGVDDILAMLLAFSALPEELEVLLISVTYGNIDVDNAVRNTVSLFYHIEQEIAWRKARGEEKLGFDALRKSKPLVAIGPAYPLMDQMLMADFFHGRDGLGDIHSTHPHLTPSETWTQIFKQAEASYDPKTSTVAEELKKADAIFTPSRHTGTQEILRLLRENEPDTITIVAIGPLTNLALAAAEDPETFLKVQEVVVMGGTIDLPGNITPSSEFNTFADSVAAARVYALTSRLPASTMPATPPSPPGLIQTSSPPPPFLPIYPSNLSRKLRVTLFPLDITERHSLTRRDFNKISQKRLDQKSPMAEWIKAFMDSTFDKIASLHPEPVPGAGADGRDDVGLALHDPLCVWYCMDGQIPREGWKISRGEDIRVETSGQWTRGMCVVDRRSRARAEEEVGVEGDEAVEIEGDHGDWLQGGKGNRLDRCVGSPGEETFGRIMLERIFAL